MKINKLKKKSFSRKSQLLFLAIKNLNLDPFSYSKYFQRKYESTSKRKVIEEKLESKKTAKKIYKKSQFGIKIIILYFRYFMLKGLKYAGVNKKNKIKKTWSQKHVVFCVFMNSTIITYLYNFFSNNKLIEEFCKYRLPTNKYCF